MRVHDAFIVRYDADGDGSISLPEHSDTSAVSFTVALNSNGTDFEGGGTWFEALGEKGMVVDADEGHAVAFAGPLRHAGYPVTKGCRVILVLFLYVDGYPYGGFLNDYIQKHGAVCGRGCQEDENNEVEQAVNDDNDVGSLEEEVRRPSGDMPGGFVVYNQTVQLVGMLNRQVESILD
jgi:hypothetical protein